jgi:uncharacterized membrane protein YeiH
MLLYVADLLGVAVFSVSGALAAGRARLDLLGVLAIAAIAAVGGGTVRDLLLNRHPIFWIRDPTYLMVVAAAALLTVGCAHFYPVPRNTLLLADALGLALFALSGAQVAEAAGLSSLIVVLMGTVSGVAGGVIRDVLTGRIPLILRADIYATAAIAGITVYLLLEASTSGPKWAFGVGFAVVIALRLLAILRGVGLPVFHLHG